jgi:TPR repeat protein
VDRITELDALLLRAWYSEAMKPGMTALEALPVLTDAVVAALGGASPDKAREAQRRFHTRVMREMIEFAEGKGELPVVLKRSGTASVAGVAFGRTLMQADLGLAHMRGTLVPEDASAAARWMEMAARDKLPWAQWMMGNFAERGVGMVASKSEAYAWYGLAAGRGVKGAKAAQQRVADSMTAAEVDAGRQRLASLEPR